MARETPGPTKDDSHSLRTAITLLKAALETAPNPRVSDGPPSYWTWYDGTRTETLDLTKDL